MRAASRLLGALRNPLSVLTLGAVSMLLCLWPLGVGEVAPKFGLANQELAGTLHTRVGTSAHTPVP